MVYPSGGLNNRLVKLIICHKKHINQTQEKRAKNMVLEQEWKQKTDETLLKEEKTKEEKC